jgi:hypothetical protein
MVSMAQPGTGHGGTHASCALTRTAPPVAPLSLGAAHEALVFVGDGIAVAGAGR